MLAFGAPQSKIEGRAKQRHCFRRQHSNLNMMSSFLGSRRPAARAAQGARTTDGSQKSHATCVDAWMTGYMSTPKAPK
jgi:hypothetical protein